MKLWLDDIREPPDQSWTWARNASEAIALLAHCEVVECSLDHDLADEHCAGQSGYMGAPSYREMTGYDVVKWMAEQNVWPAVVRVHSMNPTGADAMRKLIARYKP